MTDEHMSGISGPANSCFDDVEDQFYDDDDDGSTGFERSDDEILPNVFNLFAAHEIEPSKS